MLIGCRHCGWLPTPTDPKGLGEYLNYRVSLRKNPLNPTINWAYNSRKKKLTEKDKLAKVDDPHVQAFLSKSYVAEKLLKTIHEVMSTK